MKLTAGRYDLGVIAGVTPASDFQVRSPARDTVRGLIHRSVLWVRDGATPICKGWLSVSSVRYAAISLLQDTELSQFLDGEDYKIAVCFLLLTLFTSFFGMIPVAYAADRLGRRITIQIGAAVYMCVPLTIPRV